MEYETLKNVKFTFVPTKHWSGRGAMDQYKVCFPKLLIIIMKNVVTFQLPTFYKVTWLHVFL